MQKLRFLLKSNEMKPRIFATGQFEAVSVVFRFWCLVVESFLIIFLSFE